MFEKCCYDFDLYNGVVGVCLCFVVSFGGCKSFVLVNVLESQGVNDFEFYYCKLSGWMGVEKVFDSDVDIIDYQIVIIEYENGVLMIFYMNLNVLDQFCRFCVIGLKGMVEGDFVCGFFDVYNVCNNEKVIVKIYSVLLEKFQYYGVDEQMVEDVLVFVQIGVKQFVFVFDVIEVGILVLVMDEVCFGCKVVDLVFVWV